MYKHIQIPYSHVWHIRFLAEESLMGSLIACPHTDGLINGVYDSCKCIGPEEVWSTRILHDHPPLIKDLPVGSLSNAVLLGCVWYGEFKFDSGFSAILLQLGIDIFASMIRLQDLHMGFVVVCK